MRDMARMCWTRRLAATKIARTNIDGDTMTVQTEIDVTTELSDAKLGRLHKWLGAMMASLSP